MTALFLPFPPSVNGLFSGKDRRHKSDAYKAWLLEANENFPFQKMLSKNWKNYTGKVEIILMFKAPDNRRRDLDNLIKPVLDFLVTHKVIAGDDSRFVRKIHAGWWDEKMKESGCFVIVCDAEASNE